MKKSKDFKPGQSAPVGLATEGSRNLGRQMLAISTLAISPTFSDAERLKLASAVEVVVRKRPIIIESVGSMRILYYRLSALPQTSFCFDLKKNQFDRYAVNFVVKWCGDVVARLHFPKMLREGDLPNCLIVPGLLKTRMSQNFVATEIFAHTTHVLIKREADTISISLSSDYYNDDLEVSWQKLSQFFE
jgi:hypothetical protein